MFAAQLTMDPLRCAVIKSDGTQCDRLLGGVFDGQGIYCACCHWLVKQSDPAYQKRCNDFLHDSALSAIAGLMLDAQNKLFQATRSEEKVLRTAHDALSKLYYEVYEQARERQHPGILDYEKKREPFLKAAIEEERKAYSG